MAKTAIINKSAEYSQKDTLPSTLMPLMRMHIRLIFFVTLLLINGCDETNISANMPILSANPNPGNVKADKQLKINRDALLKGTSEQIRIDAATVMLSNDSSASREILINILNQNENTAARMAVCKALIQARTAQEAIDNKNDFIQPLHNILVNGTAAEAKLAAESLLIFDYEQVGKLLEKTTADTTLTPKSRLNAIYALRLQPDMRAITALIMLPDDADKEVAAAAENALHLLGIPVGKNALQRKQIIRELQRKGKNEFLRDWLIRQEEQIRQMETELNFWQGLYISALNRTYESMNTDPAKGNFLTEHLSSSKSIVKLWALEKVYQSRVGTTSKFPPELGPILIGLISDNDRDVRFKTAQILSLMGQLNSAQQLVKQIEIEQDEEVRDELFVALGGICHYAFSPNAEFKIPDQIRQKTLEWAAEYLFKQDAKKAQKGAEVIKKLLEQNGLAASEVDKYLGLLVSKYQQLNNQTDGTLRGELLSTMAGLCAQSVYKNEASNLFKPIFESALNDETDLVREAAADGLCYIDKTMALTKLRETMVKDSNPVIRKKLIELAGDVGGQDDLSWLATKVGPSAENEPAWQAMLKIFKRSELFIIKKWLSEFEATNQKFVVSSKQMISFLDIAEQKSISENNVEMLKSVREQLAHLYNENSKFEQAAKYFGMLREVAVTPEEQKRILNSLLDVYLKWANVEYATQLISNCLLERDLEPNSVIVSTIDDYLTKPPAGTDPNAILKALSEIKISNRPMWSRQMKFWFDRHSRSKGTDNVTQKQ